MLKILEVQLSSFAVFFVLPSRCFRHDHFEETTEMCLNSYSSHFSEPLCHTMLILWCFHLNWVFQTMCFSTHHSATRSVTFVFFLLRSDLCPLSLIYFIFQGMISVGSKLQKEGVIPRQDFQTRGHIPCH